MTESTYTTEEAIIEREINKLYGMAIARSKNKAMLKEAQDAFQTIIAYLYRQWNPRPKI